MGQPKGNPRVFWSTVGASVWMLAGVSNTAFWSFALVVWMTDESLRGPITAVMGLLLILFGVWMIRKARKKRKLVDLYKTYSAHMAGDPTRSLESLGIALNTPTAAVAGYVEQMVKKGYFGTAYVDRHTNCLVIAGESHPNGGGRRDAPREEAARTVRCKNCGAANRPPEEGHTDCEYCGSPLE